MTRQSYYDIDAILAEEELIPCTTLFEFSHLADLDPDGLHHRQQQHKEDDDSLGESSGYLPENSRVKIPLWAVETWATLGFVRLQLPRHYGRRARERYDADPGDANLRYVSQYLIERMEFLVPCHSFRIANTVHLAVKRLAIRPVSRASKFRQGTDPLTILFFRLFFP